MNLKPVYSDYHFLPGYKVEILPNYQISESRDLVVHQDRLILITRPIHAKQASNMIHSLFDQKFRPHLSDVPYSIELVLSKTIEDLNTFLISYPGHPGEAPTRSGAMLLAIYITPHNHVTFTQVGPITLKEKVAGRYMTRTANHTFDNPDEKRRISHTEVPPNLASRFIGHPKVCWIKEDSWRVIISAKPFVKTLNINKEDL